MTDTHSLATAKKWEIRLYNPNQHQEGHMSFEQERAQALAALRETVRGDGAIIMQETVSREGKEPVRVKDGVIQDGFYDPAAATGHIATWSAHGREPVLDVPNLEPSHVDAAGVVWFDVPPPVTQTGGDVRLRHGLGMPVTIYAYRGTPAEDTKMGYLIAGEVDENTASVALLPGAVVLSVKIDPAQECSVCDRRIETTGGVSKHVMPLPEGMIAHEATPSAE